MTTEDFTLIGKKILVGILVAVLPFLILLGGLWLTQKALLANTSSTENTVQTK